ncbi:hypothetical protein Droror1_Dr00015926, partial [Drosera rotundifolia]
LKWDWVGVWGFVGLVEREVLGCIGLLVVVLEDDYEVEGEKDHSSWPMATAGLYLNT